MKLNYLYQLFDDDDFEDIFKDFNFDLLNDPEFKEDAVREEIIFPLLKSIGYSASGENKIIRSKTLKHPFYYFGTTKYNVNIIPDYTFQIENENKWILEAKRPTENIDEGENVYQAYSYAMHPEIQSEIYGLCNGKKIVIFNVKKNTPVLSFEIQKLKENWEDLKNVLSPESVLKPNIKEFYHDFGLFLFKISNIESKLEPISFPIDRLDDITKLDKNTYCINQLFTLEGFEGKIFMGTFDFNKKQYLELLNLLPKDFRSIVKESLKHQPFKFLQQDAPIVNFTINALIGRVVHTNENESYLPFNVINFEK